MYCVFLRICDVAALLCSLLQYSNVIHLHLHDPNSLFMFDAIFRLLLYFSLLVGGWLCVDWFYEIDVCCGAFGLHCDMRVTDALHSGTRTWLANFASISIRHKRASLLYELKSIHTHDALDPLPISPPPQNGVESVANKARLNLRTKCAHKRHISWGECEVTSVDMREQKYHAS